MDSISITLLLDYIYNKYLVTFVLCLMGSFVKELGVVSKNSTKINISRTFVSGLFPSLIICAITDHVEMTFSVYVVVCALCGMWGSYLVQLFLNVNFIKKLLSIVLKNITGPLSKYAADLDETLKQQELDKSDDHTEDENENINDNAKQDNDDNSS